jgi:asparagine N-glycosylation enzyme membrane subunit Stt3
MSRLIETWQKRRWVRLAVYVTLVLVASVILLSPLIVPYFATRPLSRDQLMHKQP